MEKEPDKIVWVENPYVRKNKIFGIALSIIGLIFIMVLFPPLIIKKKSLLFLVLIILIWFTVPFIWFYSSKRNIAKRVGFSKDGVYFRYIGKDLYIRWDEIDLIEIKGKGFPRYYILTTNSGKRYILGFIDKSLIREMMSRKEEFLRAYSEQKG